MDSTGIRVLVDMHERLRDAGGELVLHAASAPVRRVLALTGLDRLLPLPDEAGSPPTASGPTGPH
jgi:anti-anti-sigma factor